MPDRTVTIGQASVRDSARWVLSGLRAHEPHAVTVTAGADLTIAHHLPGRVAMASLPVIVRLRRPASVTVSGMQLRDVVGALPAGAYMDVTVVAGQDPGLRLASQSVEITLPALPDGTAPEAGQIPPLAGTVPVSYFTAAIPRVAAAAGTDDTLPALTGVRFAFTDLGVELSATDRYRAARAFMPWQFMSAVPGAVTVPAPDLVRYTSYLARQDNADVHIMADDGRIVFACGGLVYVTDGIPGEFPRMTLFREESDHAARFTTGMPELRQAVKVIRKAKAGAGRLELRLIAGKGLQVAGHSPADDAPRAVIMVPGNVEADYGPVVVDTKWFDELTASCPGEITIGFGGLASSEEKGPARRSTLLQVSEPSDCRYEGLMVPVRPALESALPDPRRPETPCHHASRPAASRSRSSGRPPRRIITTKARGRRPALSPALRRADRPRARACLPNARR